MDCIPYINDLNIEIKILKDVKANGKCDINEIDRQIEEKEKLLNNCKENLSKLSDTKTEYKIYLEILNGLTPTQAIDRISNYNFINNISPSSIPQLWRIYREMKKKLKKIQNDSEMIVNSLI